MAQILPTTDDDTSKPGKHVQTIKIPISSIVDVQPIDSVSPKSESVESRQNISLDSMQESYDPQQVPPDFGIAYKHGLAMRICRLPEAAEGVLGTMNPAAHLCPCCNLPYDARRYPLCISTAQLSDLGCGFPLFFNFVKFLILFNVFCSFVSVYALIDNYGAGDEGEWDSELDGHPALSGSLAAHGTDGAPTMQIWVNISVSLVLYVTYIYMWRTHLRMMTKIDHATVTPRSFTNLLSGLPSPYSESDLAAFLEEHSLLTKSAGIAKMIPIYTIDKYIEYKQQHAKWRGYYKQGMKRRKRCGACYPNPKQCLRQMKHLRDLMRMEESNLKTANYSGSVLVTYTYDYEAKLAVANLTKPVCSKWYKLLLNIALFGRQHRTQLQFQGTKFCVQRAPEPTDILWENIGRQASLGRRALTSLSTLVLLCISGVLVFYAIQWKKQVNQNSDEDPSDLTAYVLSKLLILGPSSIIILINELLVISIKLLTKQERHSTTTKYNTNVCVKITAALFANTGIVTLLEFGQEIYGKNGIIEEMFLIILANAIVSPISPLLSLKIYLKLIRRRIALRQGDDCKLTQQQANTLFQGVDIDISERLANFMKTFYLAMLYGPVLPVVYWISVCSLLAEYWVVKYMLLRIYCRPPQLSYQIDKTMLRMVPVGFILFCFSNFYFQVVFNDDAFWPGLAGILLIILLILSPWKSAYQMQEVIKELRKFDDFNTSDVGKDRAYEDFAVDFFEDYERANPVTSEQGYQNWVELIQRKNGTYVAQKIQGLLDDVYSDHDETMQATQRSSRVGTASQSRSSVLNPEASARIRGLARFDPSAAMQHLNKLDAYRFRNRYIAQKKHSSVKRQRYARPIATLPPQQSNETPAFSYETVLKSSSDIGPLQMHNRLSALSSLQNDLTPSAQNLETPTPGVAPRRTFGNLDSPESAGILPQFSWVPTLTIEETSEEHQDDAMVVAGAVDLDGRRVSRETSAFALRFNHVKRSSVHTITSGDEESSESVSYNI